MNFIKIDHQVLDQGKEVFKVYSRAAICGGDDREGHAASKRRVGGLATLPGAAVACFDSGIIDKRAAASAIARATRCRVWTVESFLSAFLGEADETGTYDEMSGYLLEKRLLSNSTMLAA